MPEPTLSLTEEAAVTVLAVPGVLRLEPTLLNALKSLRGSHTAGSTGPDEIHVAAEGVRTSRTGDQVDCHVDISIDRSRPATEVAQDVQTALEVLLRTQRLTPGAITVAVLDLST